MHALELARRVQNAAAGGDHVVHDDDVLPLQIAPEELMRHNRILAVDDAGIVPSLVEHSGIHAQNAGKINGPVQCTLVRRDHDEMLLVQNDIGEIVYDRLEKRIGRNKIVKIRKGRYVLDSRIVRIKGDEILDAEIHQLPEHVGSVQRFPSRALVLSSLVQKRHDNGNSGGLAVDGGDDALEILKVIIRRHMVDKAVHLIGQRIVGHIGQDEDVLAAAGVLDHALSLTGAEAHAFGLHAVIIAHISCKGRIVLHDAVVILPEISQMLVHGFPQLFCGRQDQELQRRGREFAFQLLMQLQFGHKEILSSFRFFFRNCFVIVSHPHLDFPTENPDVGGQRSFGPFAPADFNYEFVRTRPIPIEIGRCETDSKNG